jgi:amino acid adenylation domain-containing protein
LQVEWFLEQSARRFPDKPALTFGDRSLTYAELDAACNAMARGLLAAGLQRGDRVVIHLDNSVEAVLAVFAVLKAGGVFVVVNPTTKADKLRFIVNNSRATVLVAHARREAVLHEVADERIPIVGTIVVVGGPFPGEPPAGKQVLRFDQLVETRDGARNPDSRGIDTDLAALIYTSGSTGTPKGVMLTHLNITSSARSITTYLENTPDDVVINVLPLSFDYGLYQVLMTFRFGGRIVLERSLTYPHALLETMVRERVTGLPIVPSMSAILLQLDLSRYDLSSLRYITNTAAALPTEHILKIRSLLPHVKIYSMYGLTECKRVSYLPPQEIDAHPTSVGRAMPNVEAFVIDPQGNRLTTGVGELVVRGSNVMKGYWEQPEETDRVLKLGALPGERVLLTGDLFRVDEEGFLYFVGRKDDIIKTRGEKVSPREVENVLYSLTGVREAAILGVPHPVLGQAIKAVLTVHDGITLDQQDVLRHCADRLEDFMVPAYVEFRSSMPRTSTGKIDKRALDGSPADLLTERFVQVQ